MPLADVSNHPLQQLLSLDGRVAVVTGAARGVGRAISHRLAEAGAHVVMTDIDRSALDDATPDITERIAKASLEPRELDVTDTSSVEALVHDVATAHGSLDVWVNNAGAYPVQFLDELTREHWDAVLDLNATASMFAARAASRVMVNQGAGVIVNIASTNSYRAAPGLAAYVTSKHAVHGIVKSLGAELAQHGVRVVGVAPSLVDTPGIDTNAETLRRVFEGADPREAFAGVVPAGRVATPDDVARVVLFAASDLATYVTGTNLSVDGGLLAI